MTAATRDLEAPTVADARAAVESAAVAQRRAAGVVLAVAETHRGCIPAPLATAVDRYVETRDAHRVAREIAGELAAAAVQHSPAVLADVLERAALNAMVAHYVDGRRVIMRDDEDGRFAPTWRVEDPGGKRKPLPDYASDVTAAAKAERALPLGALDDYAMTLALETRGAPGGYSARLDADAPPAWIRNRTAPGG
jgi:hypothetical protein